MPSKKHKPEEVIGKLREAEIVLAQGGTTPEACRRIGIKGEIFYSLVEAKVLIETWRRPYNTARPHSSPGYRPAAPETEMPPSPNSGSASLHLKLATEAIMH